MSRVCVNGVAAQRLSQRLRSVAVVLLFGSECVVCGVAANGICGTCVDRLEPPVVPPLLAIDDAVVLCSYSGIGAELVTAVKYHNKRLALSPLCDALAGGLSSEFDAIVAVPADPSRRRERGFHVPELIAKRLSRRIEVPVVEPLTRADSGSQQGRSREERAAVEFRASGRVPERVLLVADVVTTGATAVACALTLGLAGARHISFVALAATPPPMPVAVS